MQHTPTRRQLSDLKKFPWQWAIIVLCAVVAALWVGYQARVDKTDTACDVRIAALQRALSKKDSSIFDWQNKYISLSTELLYKNNIIDRQSAALQKTDSVARKKFEKPAKQIVKQNE